MFCCLYNRIILFYFFSGEPPIPSLVGSRDITTMDVFDEMADFFKTLEGPSPEVGLKKDVGISNSKNEIPMINNFSNQTQKVDPIPVSPIKPTDYELMIKKQLLLERLQREQGLPRNLSTLHEINSNSEPIVSEITEEAPTDVQVLPIQEQQCISNCVHDASVVIQSTEPQPSSQSLKKEEGIPQVEDSNQDDSQLLKIKALEEQLSNKIAEHNTTATQLSHQQFVSSVSTALNDLSSELQFGFSTTETIILDIVSVLQGSPRVCNSSKDMSASKNTPGPVGGKKVAFNLDRNQYRSYYHTVMAEQRGEALSQDDEDRMMAEQLQRVFNDELNGKSEGYGARHGRRRKK